MTGIRLLGDEFRAQMPRGSYGRNERGEWEICTPNGRMGRITGHTVVEHEDGTITVTPSILVHAVERSDGFEGRPAYHGFLERGIWRHV